MNIGSLSFFVTDGRVDIVPDGTVGTVNMCLITGEPGEPSTEMVITGVGRETAMQRGGGGGEGGK